MSSFLGFLKRLRLPLANRLNAGRQYKIILIADIAQLGEQRLCNAHVGSSNLSVGTNLLLGI